MNGQFDLITLIALVVAVAAIIKLRSVLGQRTDDDEQRVERLKTREREATAQRAATEGASADVITMPRRDREPLAPAPAAEAAAANIEARIRAYQFQIRRSQPAFSILRSLTLRSIPTGSSLVPDGLTR